MMSHLSSNKLIDDSQHGFLPSYSTASQLLEWCYDWNKSADEGKPTDVFSILILAKFSTVFRTINYLISLNQITSVITL